MVRYNGYSGCAPTHKFGVQTLSVPVYSYYYDDTRLDLIKEI